MGTFLVVFREVLEASLIVGIVASFLKKKGQHGLMRWVSLGIVGGLVASGLFAWAVIALKGTLGGSAYEALFEAILMMLAAGLLLWMLVWMRKGVYPTVHLGKRPEKHACLSCELHPENKALRGQMKKSVKHVLQQAADDALGSSTPKWTIFGLIASAIAREGFETVIFLLALQSMGDVVSWSYALIAIGLGVAVGWAFFVLGKRFSLRGLFHWTSVVLVIFAAGMMTYGIHEFEEYLADSGYIDEDAVIRAWDIFQPVAEAPATHPLWTFDSSKEVWYHPLHDKGSIGLRMKAFVGRNSNPNLLEPMIWMAIVVFGWVWIIREPRKQE